MVSWTLPSSEPLLLLISFTNARDPVSDSPFLSFTALLPLGRNSTATPSSRTFPPFWQLVHKFSKDFALQRAVSFSPKYLFGP